MLPPAGLAVRDGVVCEALFTEGSTGTSPERSWSSKYETS
jgi:hypothetical protein